MSQFDKRVPKKYKLKGFTREEMRKVQNSELVPVTKHDLKITEHEVIFLDDGPRPKFVIVACYDTNGMCPFLCENCDRSKEKFEKCFNISLDEARKIINAVPEMCEIYDKIIGYTEGRERCQR